MVRRVLSSSRYFILMAVLGSFLASASALLYGSVASGFIVPRTFGQGDFSETGAKLLAVTFLGSAVTWSGGYDILALGLAVGVVLGVVSMTIAIMTRTHTDHPEEASRGAHTLSSASPPAVFRTTNRTRSPNQGDAARQGSGRNSRAVDRQYCTRGLRPMTRRRPIGMGTA